MTLHLYYLRAQKHIHPLWHILFHSWFTTLVKSFSFGSQLQKYHQNRRISFFTLVYSSQLILCNSRSSSSQPFKRPRCRRITDQPQKHNNTRRDTHEFLHTCTLWASTNPTRRGINSPSQGKKASDHKTEAVYRPEDMLYAQNSKPWDSKKSGSRGFLACLCCCCRWSKKRE